MIFTPVLEIGFIWNKNKIDKEKIITKENRIFPFAQAFVVVVFIGL